MTVAQPLAVVIGGCPIMAGAAGGTPIRPTDCGTGIGAPTLAGVKGATKPPPSGDCAVIGTLALADGG